MRLYLSNPHTISSYRPAMNVLTSYSLRVFFWFKRLSGQPSRSKTNPDFVKTLYNF